jgi:hypothetical protein
MSNITSETITYFFSTWHAVSFALLQSVSTCHRLPPPNFGYESLVINGIIDPKGR